MYATTHEHFYNAGDLSFASSPKIHDFSEFEDVSREVILARGKSFDPLSRFAEFEQRFPQAMEVLDLAGVHPTRHRDIFDPYKKVIDTSKWQNVGEHCLAVANAGIQIAEELARIGILSDTAVERIGERCLVHDATKRYEVLRRKAEKAGLFQGDAYAASEYEALGQVLKDQGVDSDLADYLTHSGKETGHTSFRSFMKIHSNRKFGLADLPLADKIIHLADDITYTELVEGRSPVTMYLTPAERMVAAEFNKRIPWMFEKGLALAPDQTITDVENVSNLPEGFTAIGTYAYLQPRISGAICHQLRNLIAFGIRPGIISDEELVLSVVRGELKSAG